MSAKNYANTRYSGLDQINTSNVSKLQVAWTFSTGISKGHEAAPIIVNKTMYIITPYPNILYAIDLAKPGQAKWKYEANPSPSSQGVACCDVVNRGGVYDNGRIYFNSLDAHTHAVDANTARRFGRPSWVRSTWESSPLFVANKDDRSALHLRWRRKRESPQGRISVCSFSQ